MIGTSLLASHGCLLKKKVELSFFICLSNVNLIIGKYLMVLIQKDCLIFGEEKGNNEKYISQHIVKRR